MSFVSRSGPVVCRGQEGGAGGDNPIGPGTAVGVAQGTLSRHGLLMAWDGDWRINLPGAAHEPLSHGNVLIWHDASPGNVLRAEPRAARYIEAHAAVNTLKVPGAVYVSAPEWQTHGLGRVYSIASE